MAQSRLDQIQTADEMLESIFSRLDPNIEMRGGASLREQLKQLIESTAEQLEKAADQNPLRVARLLVTLGRSLLGLDEATKAEALLRRAAALDPKDASAYFTLGVALHVKGRLDEAMAAYRHAIRFKPGFAEAHYNLAYVLSQKGRFAEALACYRQAHELGTNQPGWRYPSAQSVRKAERLLALDKQLKAILRGEASPINPGEAIALASMCQQPYKKLHAASARLYADALAADPKLIADLKEQHRYIAACSAALVAAGQSEDASSVPEKERIRLRRKALAWLRDDLAAYTKLAQQNNPNEDREIQRRLAYWRRDPDFASVRDSHALDRLPDSERAAWQSLWHDVDALAKRVAKKPEQEKPAKKNSRK